MKKTILASVVAGSLALSVGAASASTVSTVSVLDLGSAFPGLFEGYMQNGNVIDLKLLGFKAQAGDSFGSTSILFDTQSLKVTAPTNYQITSITYVESGNRERIQPLGTTTVTQALGSFVVEGVTEGFQLLPGSGALANSPWNNVGATINLATPVESVIVSITNNLLAVAVGTGSYAMIEKTDASLEIGVALIPLPPSVWLLGSALFGVGVLGRRIRGLKAA